MSEMETRRERNCIACAHYFITHDVRFPYGCRAMGFKCEGLPSKQVVAVTGGSCLMYQPKQKSKGPAMAGPKDPA